MRRLAQELGEDEELWGISALLHDLDLEAVEDDMSQHGLLTAEWLRGMGFPEEGIDAVLRHNAEGLGLSRSTRFDHALAAAEQITGLVRATALVYPSRKVADVKPRSVLKRMKDKRFAAKVNRDRIRECSLVGVDLSDFVKLSLEAMSAISDELEL